MHTPGEAAMSLLEPSSRKHLCSILLASAFLAALFAGGGKAARAEDLLIGTSGTIGDTQEAKEKSALETLRAFIKEETGMNNQITPQRDWRELADKMTKGKLQIGVFQGHEFAWTQEKYSKIKPLALAVNLYRYPVVYVVTKKDNPAKDFAGLKGQTISLPVSNSSTRLFVEHECKKYGKDNNSFFSKITDQKNVEDALDDVVDGLVTATAVDKAGLQAFKRRKPGRFNQLKEIAHSHPLPPPVVAYGEGSLSESTLQTFRKGLLNAARKERGKTMLTLFHLTGFDEVPADFDKVLAQTRKTFPLMSDPTKETSKR
jgi:ABC-type phosphate/phosphonate transport system substrate-binding protein